MYSNEEKRITFLDINGNLVQVFETQVFNVLLNLFITGMTRQEILELRNQYVLKGGPLPPTVDFIKAVFSK